MRKVTIGFCLLLAAACAHHQSAAAGTPEQSAAGQDQQPSPAESVQAELRRAQDLASKARANEADAKARVEVAKSEREVGEAQARRAAAQRELLKKQGADKDAVAQSDRDVSAAQDAIHIQEAKVAFLNQHVSACVAERNAAEAHVATQEVTVEQSKHEALHQGGSPQSASINPAQLDSKLAEARKREAEAQKQAIDRRAQAQDLYDRWARLDSKARAVGVAQQQPAH